MTGLATLSHSGDEPALSDPPALVQPGTKWTRWLGPLLSLAILFVVYREVGRFDMGRIEGMMPRHPWFWIVFILSYCATPFFEWIIFRRLWSIPSNGFIALMRKRISNELLLGYVGEIYFYTWARQNGRVIASPFGAIKDVAILSAVCGNIVALGMSLFALPIMGTLPMGIDNRLLAASVGIIVLTSVLPLLMGRKLFGLPDRELRFITLIHLVRIAATTLVSAYLWHLVLPQVELGWWFLLATIRQLVSRLPLIPNKDVLFVGIAVFFLGNETQITGLLALMAGLILAAHLVVGALLGVLDLVAQRRKLCAA